MDGGEGQEGRHACRDHPQGGTGRSVQEPVAPTLEGREAGLVCARHPRALRHAEVPGVGDRPPARGAGDAPALPAHDARLDETVGGWRDVEAARQKEAWG
jgi:hypothetical protein